MLEKTVNKCVFCLSVFYIREVVSRGHFAGMFFGFYLWF